MERKLSVGDVVKITTKLSLLGNDPGALGVVYEEYDLGYGPGASVIFPNGEYDGFSPEEQRAMLERVGHCKEVAGYQFDNVMRLSHDFQRGFFAPAFSPESDIERDRRTA